MSDAVNKQPTLDEQISSFKGFSTEEGQITSTTSTKAIAAAQTADDKAIQGSDKPLTAAERLAQLDKPAKAAKAAAQGAEDGEEGEAEGADKDEDEEGEEEQRQPERRARRNDPQKRISEAVGRQRAAERRAEAAERALSDLNARMARLEGGGLTPRQNGGSNGATQSDQNTPPDPADYQYGELDTKFIADTARFETLKTLREEDQRRQIESRSQRESAAQHEAAAKYQSFETAGLTRYDDFHEVVTESAQRGEWSLSPILASLLVDSDNGPDIAYHLASNPAEAAKVFAMTPAQQARWFGQRDAVLASAPGATGRTVDTSRVISQAPDVPRREARGTGSRQQVAPDTTDFAAFEKLAQPAR